MNIIVYLAEVGSDNHIWSHQDDNLERVAGILAAGIGIVDDLNEDRKGEYYIDSSADVSSFRKVSSITADEITAYSCNRLTERQYGLWMKSNKRFYYSLYAFETESFFQGIISVCSSFGVDFRNYIYGLPFDGHGNQYALDGYVMTQYMIAQDAPDLTDIEEEEADDENVIEPLTKDY